jgi:glutamate synthase domain-containing protein 3
MATLDLQGIADVQVVSQSEGGLVVDATGMAYRDLNMLLRALMERGATRLHLRGISGQRYLGTNLQKAVRITVEGVPGQDLGAFMDGPTIEVLGDAQDGCGNTMNSGTIVIHGSAGDILGHSMRGGEIFVRDHVGYRVGIHMKEYGAGPWGGTGRPVIVIGGTAQHFLGEYMAGGMLLLLGGHLASDEPHPAHYIGTGMHGGVIYLRGRVSPTYLGKEVGQQALSGDDEWLIQRYVARYAELFDADAEALLRGPFTKLVPLTRRPYGQLYAY